MNKLETTTDVYLFYFILFLSGRAGESCSLLFDTVLRLCIPCIKNLLNQINFYSSSLLYSFKAYMYVFLEDLTQTDKGICISLLRVTKTSKSNQRLERGA